MGWTDKIGDAWTFLNDNPVVNTVDGAVDDTFGAIGGAYTVAAKSPFGEAVGFLTKPIGRGLNDTANALTYPVNRVKRGMSTIQIMSDRAPGVGAFDGDAWSKAWDTSEDVSIGQAMTTSIRDTFGIGGEDDFAAGSFMDGEGRDPYTGVKAGEAHDYYTGTWPGRLSSGSLDLFLTLGADPLVFAGEAAAAATLAKKTIRAEDVAGALDVATNGARSRIAGAAEEPLEATPEEAIALSNYTGAGYDVINPALREGKKLTRDSPQQVEHIDNLLSRTPGLSEPTTLYRIAARGDSVTNHLSGAKVGDVISDPAFMSTSRTEEGAASLLEVASEGKVPVFLEIKAYPGAKVLDVNDVASQQGGLGAFAGEQEMLLPRGAKMKIVSDGERTLEDVIGEERTVRHLVAELVDERPPVDPVEASKTALKKGEVLKALFYRTDSMSASQMMDLPEFRNTTDAGAIAQFFDSVNTLHPTDEVARHAAKADVFGAVMGDTQSISNLKNRSAALAEQIQRVGEPPVQAQALAVYDKSDFGRAMIESFQKTPTGVQDGIVDESLKEMARLQRVLTIAGSSRQIAAGPMEKLGASFRAQKNEDVISTKLQETIIPNGLGGRPVRIVAGQASSRVPGTVHLKDPARGYEDLSNVVTQMKHTPAAERRALLDAYTKAATEGDRRIAVEAAESRMFVDAAAKYRISKEDAEAFLDAAKGRRGAYNDSMKGRLYSAADDSDLVKFVDPEDDMEHVFSKAFLQTHLEDTHMITNPLVIEKFLKRGTNRRMLQRWAEGTRLQGAARGTANLTSDTLDTLDNWATMATRVWKDMALMRPAYPIRIQVDSQMRVMAHLGMMKWFMDGKTAQGTYWLTNAEKSGRSLKNLFVEGDYQAALRGSFMKGEDYKGVPTAAALDEDELAYKVGELRSHGGGAADLGNDVSNADLRAMRKNSDFGKIQPSDPAHQEAWVRAATQIKSSPTARALLQYDDLDEAVAAVQASPEMLVEYGKYRAGYDNLEDWLTHVMANNNRVMPTPEIRALVDTPEEALAYFDYAAVGQRIQAKGAIKQLKRVTDEDVKAARTGFREAKAAWELTPKRSPERRAAKQALADARKQLNLTRVERDRVKNQSRQLNQPIPAGTMAPSGLIEPVAVHGEALSPLVENGLNARWNKFREGFYEWAGDAPETIMARSPIYLDSFKRHIKETVDNLGDEGVDMIGVDAIRKNADRAARREVGQVLFDATHASNLSHSMRFISPFFAAWEDTAVKWAKLMGNDPKLAPTFAKVWNSPENVGMVVDADGFPIKAGDPSPEKGEYLIIPKIPGIDKIIPGNGGKQGKSAGMFKIRRDNMNILFQGEPPWLPGNGPLVQIPANALISKYAVKEADHPIVKYFVPFGITDDSALRQTLPGWAKQMADTGLFGKTKDYNATYVLLYNQELGAFNRGERQTKPDADEIGNKTRNWYLLRAGLNSSMPVTIQPVPKDQFYIDKAREYRSDPERENWQQDFYDDFPGYFEMSSTLSVNETGLESTNDAFDAAQKYRKDIAENPELGWFFAGPDNLSGEFNQNVNTWMRSNEAGKGKNFKSSRSPVDAINRVQEQKGWIEYNKAATAINLAMESRGLHSLQQAGAEDLADAKRIYTEQLMEYNPAFAAAFGAGQAEQRRRTLISVARSKWAKDKEFAARPDQVMLKQYLDARIAVQKVLATRENSTLSAESNADLAEVWGLYSSELRKFSPSFEQLFNRTFESDDLSQVL